LVAKGAAEPEKALTSWSSSGCAFITAISAMLSELVASTVQKTLG
jgi:hypothetical protein